MRILICVLAVTLMLWGVRGGSEQRRENKKIVEAYNRVAAEARLNTRFGLSGPFADLSREEFRATVLMPRVPYAVGDDICTLKTGGTPMTPPAPIPHGALDNLPESFDWRTKGPVGPVRDQGSVGTCWAFSTVENVAGQAYMKNGGAFVPLSVEQLNDCDYTDCGVFGGWPCHAMQYVVSAGGLLSESDYPYCVGNGDCYPCQAQGTNLTFCGPGPSYCNETQWPCKVRSGTPHPPFAATIKGWTWFQNENETALQYRLMQTGPLSILMDASELQYYEGGVFSDPFCSPDALDHAVLLVGWGVEKDLFGTYPYWIVKNSWGTDWGLDGYFYLIRVPDSTTGPCGMATNVISALL